MTDIEARNAFFDGGASDEALADVPEPVLRSWTRLRKRKQGLVKRFGEVPGPTEVAFDADFLRSVRKVAPKLRLTAGDPELSICILSDSTGRLAAFDGGETITHSVASAGWQSSMSFSEEFAGTNALDLALRDREQSVTRGGQHTHLALEDKTLLAHPLVDQGGELLGALGLLTSDEASIRTAKAALSLCAMLLMNTLQSERASLELSRRLAEQKAVADAMRSGMMVVNRSGLIEYMNAPAGRILRADPEIAVGRKLADVIGFAPVIAPIFDSGAGYTEEEVSIQRDGQTIRLIDTATPIVNGAGVVVSVVNTFREFERVAQVARKFSGNHAQYTFDQVIGRSPSMLTTIEKAKKAAASSSNILITGESGTGKELFAQGIHTESPRASGPFVAINCAALPRDLIESELFGYMPGSFTGAQKTGRPGKFEIASGGTIFLDEVSEIPFDVQAKLLRVLQEREITRVGGVEPIAVDVRLICAMNRDPRTLVAEGRFREDLYYRINVIEIAVPALRDRKGDIRLLAEHYVEYYAGLLDKPARRLIDPVLRRLEAYEWPGNVRELQNTIERMVNFADGPTIGEGLELPKGAKKSSAQPSQTKPVDGEIPTLAEMERRLIGQALAATSFNVTSAAKLLGLTKPRLYRMVDRHEIVLERTRR